MVTGYDRLLPWETGKISESMQKTTLLTNAIIAVTLNCNSRCVMCNIWKNRMTNEVSPTFYNRLPTTLTDINITGGEPFLRRDLDSIVAVMKKRCPKARMVINTNGFLPDIIGKTTKKILLINPSIAIRVSLDGWGETHNRIRGIARGFDRCLESLRILRNVGVTDLGIAFTLMESNYREAMKMYAYAKKNRYEFSITLVSESPIYFGSGKQSLRPTGHVGEILNGIAMDQLHSFNPKNWFRAWFNRKLADYYRTGKRTLVCDAGRRFVYIDSLGSIYACHLKPWKMGNLTESDATSIFNSLSSEIIRQKAENCNGCWMVCTAKTGIKNSLLHLLPEVALSKIYSNYRHS